MRLFVRLELVLALKIAKISIYLFIMQKLFKSVLLQEFKNLYPNSNRKSYSEHNPNPNIHLKN